MAGKMLSLRDSLQQKRDEKAPEVVPGKARCSGHHPAFYRALTI